MLLRDIKTRNASAKLTGNVHTVDGPETDSYDTMRCHIAAAVRRAAAPPGKEFVRLARTAFLNAIGPFRGTKLGVAPTAVTISLTSILGTSTARPITTEEKGGLGQ